MDVIFESQRGKFSIELGYWDTVLEIKEKIQKYQGIPVSKQTLIFDGRVLQDDLDIDKCLILESSNIQLLIADDSAAAPTAADDSPPLPPSAAADKPAAAPPLSTPDRQLPPENNNNNNNSVRDCDPNLENNTNSSDPHVIARPLVTNSPSGTVNNNVNSNNNCNNNNSSNNNNNGNNGNKKMRVMVLPKSGNMKIPVDVSASDNVGELRKELQKLHQRHHFHLPPEGYFFIYKQNVMDDDRSFRWHHVSPGDTIEIFNGSVTGGS